MQCVSSLPQAGAACIASWLLFPKGERVITGMDLQREEEAFFDTYFPAGVARKEGSRLSSDDREIK